MTNFVVPEYVDGDHARNFIPVTYWHLPMLRIFLPRTDSEGVVRRWSFFLPKGADLKAATSWTEIATTSSVSEVQSCTAGASAKGEVDTDLIDALVGAIGPRVLTFAGWNGYADHLQGRTTRLRGDVYRIMEADLDSLRASVRLPEFAWDASGEFAWGGRLYPDSIVVAAEKSIFRTLMSDATIDAVAVRADRDVLPLSAND